MHRSVSGRSGISDVMTDPMFICRQQYNIQCSAVSSIRSIKAGGQVWSDPWPHVTLD